MNSLDRHYAKLADTLEGRNDHDVAVAYKGRMYQSEGATGRAWLKFNPGQSLIYVDDAEGIPRGLTPKQYAVLRAILEVIEAGTHPTMTAVARRLGYAISTVSRAMTKLAAWGLIRYFMGRGRYAGLIVFRAVKNDGLERVRKEAKERLRRLYQAAAARISRTKVNVAPMKPTTTYGVFVGTDTDYVTDNVIGATLKSWTPDELRSAGIL